MSGDRRSRGAWIRFLVLVLVLGGAALTIRQTGLANYLESQRLVELLDAARSHPLAPAAHLGLFLLLAPLGVPVSPLILAGGAVFGTWLGALLNFLGLMGSGTITYLFARFLGRELVVRVLRRYQRLLARMVRQHGFWALVRLRFVPLPFVIANLAAALLGVPLTTFLSSSALAFAPSMLVYSYFASSLTQAAEGARGEVVRNVLIAMALFLALTFVPTVWLGLRRRAHLRRLQAVRRQRKSTG